MANIGKVTFDILDGGIGALGVSDDYPPLLIGCCSAGTINALVGVGNTQAMISGFGFGPLVDAASCYLELGIPVNVIRANASSSGSAGSVTRTQTGDGTMTVAAGSGGPFDVLDVKFKVITGGDLGTASVAWSVDGGDHYGDEYLIPSDGAIAMPGTNLTVTFANGSSGSSAPASFVAGDLFAFKTTGPSFSSGDLANAIQVWLDSREQVKLVHVVGVATASLAAAVDTHMANAASRYKFTVALMESRDQSNSESTVTAWQTALQEEWAGYSPSSKRTWVVAPWVEMYLPSTKTLQRRPGAWIVGPWAAKLPISVDVGETARGPLPYVTKLYQDSRVNPGLDGKLWTVLKTFDMQTGVYARAGETTNPESSDYHYLVNRLVMDQACRVAYLAGFPLINKKLRADAKTGLLLEADAKAIDRAITSKLETALVNGFEQHCSAVKGTVRRDTNTMSTGQVVINIAVTPLLYGREIKFAIGFVNPALASATS